MTLRPWAITLLAVALTVPAHGPTTASDVHVPPRQISVAPAPPATQHPDTQPAAIGHAHAPVGQAPSPAADLPDRFDPDIPVEALAFDTAAVDALLATGTTTLHLPGAGSVTLQLDTHRRRAGTDFITARAAGLTSSLTRRDNTFFLTLATPGESYRIEGNASGSRLYRHSVLAQRTISHAIDYRYID